MYSVVEQLSLFDPGTSSGKTSRVCSVPDSPQARTSGLSSKKHAAWWTVPRLYLDLRAGNGSLLGPLWETDFPSPTGRSMHNFSESLKEGVESILSQILEDSPQEKYYLSLKACAGILRRAQRRGRELPPQLREALEIQAGMKALSDTPLLNLNTAKSKVDPCASVVCLNDQGGSEMHLTEDVTGTLRSQEHGHQPLVMATQQGGAEIGEGICPAITASAGMSGNNQPVLFNFHGQDSRISGPVDVTQTVASKFGTGGSNTPLAMDYQPVYCIAANTVDRQPENGGNGTGIQENITYTLTTTDHHCIAFSMQRSDRYREGEVTATQGARQYKSAADLICQPEVAGVDCRNMRENGDICGTLQAKENGGQSLNTTHPVRVGMIVRRLTPLECERLQGYPDQWTDIPGASDSARYRALGNSVAIPCVEFVMRGVAYFLRMENAD